MGKKKLQRFAENLTFVNLFQPGFKDLEDGFTHRGRWHEYFQNNNPIILELGCGKGEYAIGLAARHPERNYIGIDIKGARLWKGCKLSHDMGLNNVAFIRTRIELIEKFFIPGEVKELYITFPDPQPKRIREKKRLTSGIFLRRYLNILDPDHTVHLKTDDAGLFEYTQGLIHTDHHQLFYSTNDVYNSNCPEEIREIQTFYEQKWLEKGKKINYIAFKIHPYV